MKYKNNSIQISCDGGAATGKSTGAKMISKKYRLNFLSSGLLYRYASYLILKYKPKDQINFLKKKFKKLNYKKLEKMDLHNPEISNHSSIIAKKNEIRNILKKFQKDFSKKYANCCIEGRDISTKILPKSDLKFFFICNLQTAANRRYKELKKKYRKIKLKEVKKALRIRNIFDTKRKYSPLLKHRNSIVINSSKLSKSMMLTKMSFHVDRVLKKKYDSRTKPRKN